MSQYLICLCVLLRTHLDNFTLHLKATDTEKLRDSRVPSLLPSPFEASVAYMSALLHDVDRGYILFSWGGGGGGGGGSIGRVCPPPPPPPPQSAPGKCLCAAFKGRATPFFEPYQYGVACPHGAERIIHG